MAGGNHERIGSVHVRVRLVAVCLLMATIAGCGDGSPQTPTAASESDVVDTDAVASSVDATTPTTTATPDSSDRGSAPPPSPAVTTTPPPSRDEMAFAAPEHVLPGDRVTITPGTSVERNCTDIVGVYDFDDVILGQVLGGDHWIPVSPGASPTWPACLGPTTDASMDITVPPLPHGGYRFCLSVVVDFAGCATVFVMEAAPPNPVITSPQSNAVEEALIQGRLTERDGCLFIDASEGGVGVAVLTFGTTWDADTSSVIDPSGNSLSIGSVITASGGGHQITQLGDWLPPATVAAIERCGDVAGTDRAIVVGHLLASP